MKRKHQKLRTKLLLISAGSILIPLSILSFFAFQATAHSITETFCNNQVVTLKKAGASTNNMLHEIERTSLLVITNHQLRTYLLEEPKIETRWNAYSLLAYLKNSSDVISSLHLLGNSDNHILTLGDNSADITREDQLTALAYRGRAFWRAKQDASSHTPGIYMCRLIRNVVKPTQHLGYIKLYLNLNAFANELYNENDPATTYYLLDGDGTVMYSTNPHAEYGLPPVSTLMENNSICIMDREQSRSITAYRLSTGSMMLVGTSSLASINEQVRANALLYFGISLSCFLFCLLLSFYLSMRSLSPLAKLMTHMRRLEQEDFNTRIELRQDDEFSKLAAQFNSMAAKIQSLIEEVYSVSLRRKEAELRALQTQIKPHFLYNTLDLAYWTAQSEKAPMTAEMIDSLSQFFRFGLICDSELTTVENEIEHLRFYMVLRHQHNPNFDFNQEVAPETLHCRVVKLVLQPLVENAFLHGISGKKNGKIDVAIFREGDTLVYHIKDNGNGIDVPDIERLLCKQGDGTRGIGLRNVNDRIRLAFGERYGITVHNCQEGGTLIRVTQPFVKQGENDD